MKHLAFLILLIPAAARADSCLICPEHRWSCISDPGHSREPRDCRCSVNKYPCYPHADNPQQEEARGGKDKLTCGALQIPQRKNCTGCKNGYGITTMLHCDDSPANGERPAE